MSEVSLGSMYDINKNLMNKENALSLNKINTKIKELIPFFTKGTYFMLLCHERRDYTVFQVKNDTYQSPILAAKELRDCLTNRGCILAIDLDESGSAYEIWIRNEEGCFAYYLFPYDEAVIIC